MVISASPDRFAGLVGEHAAWLAACQYAATTVRSRRRDLGQFAAWCGRSGVASLAEVTVPVVEEYRLALHRHRKPDGDPLGCGSLAQKLLAIKRFLRWAARMRVIPADVGAAIELPRRPQSLPRHVLSEPEMERVLAGPDLRGPEGLRDRAILETLYSTGIRRLELIHLTPLDVSVERGVVFVRKGKGSKDRVVPIGERALGWVGRYRAEVRPRLVRVPDPGNLFLTRRGRPLRPNRLTELVHRYVARADLGKVGSCHMFRHTMATLMLDHGADVRYIQEILGHAQLTTTALYTRVSITRLKEVHGRTHPASREVAPPLGA